MSNKRILGMVSGQEELWDKADKQGYVWIKTENGFVTKDDLNSYNRLCTVWYRVWLRQRDYGKTWAFTKEELTNESK